MPSRRARTRFPEEIRYIRQIGEVLHAWNGAHGALFRVFVDVVSMGNYDLAHSVWHSVQSDKYQRDMLESFVRHKFDRKKRSFRAAILWSIAALNELSTRRNDIAHSEMAYFYERPEPGMSIKAAAAKRLEEMPISKQWRKLRGDLNALANYLDYISLSLWMNYPRPLPRRPRLQLVHSKTEQTQKRRHRAKKAVRERQRQSSRG